MEIGLRGAERKVIKYSRERTYECGDVRACVGLTDTGTHVRIHATNTRKAGKVLRTECLFGMMVQ